MHRDGHRTGRRAGFTLVELVIVIAIVSSLALIAVPRFAGSINQRRSEAAAERIRADLLLARSDARALSQDRVVQFDTVNSTYEIVGRGSADRSGAQYIVDLTVEPLHATLGAVSFGGSKSVTFDAYGGISSGGTVEVLAGSAVRTVVLDEGLARALIQ